jgi:hypothetical protein
MMIVQHVLAQYQAFRGTDAFHVVNVNLKQCRTVVFEAS